MDEYTKAHIQKQLDEGKKPNPLPDIVGKLLSPLERIEIIKGLCEVNISCKPNLQDILNHLEVIKSELIAAEDIATETIDHMDEFDCHNWFLWERCMNFVDRMMIRRPLPNIDNLP